MWLAVSGGTLSALDSASGRPLASPVPLTKPEDFLLNDGEVALVPRPGHDGQVVLAGARDVEIWDALSGRELTRIPVPNVGKDDMAFDPSGERIALLNDKSIELWDVASAHHLRPPIPLADGQALAGFDADGYLDVLTGNPPERLAFLDMDRGQSLGSMDTGLGVKAASMVGDSVVPVDSTGDILPYELPVTAQQWHDRLCAVVNRPFTPAELALLPPGTDTDPPCS
jgi:WD40 repeat protein